MSQDSASSAEEEYEVGKQRVLGSIPPMLTGFGFLEFIQSAEVKGRGKSKHWVRVGVVLCHTWTDASLCPQMYEVKVRRSAFSSRRPDSIGVRYLS